MRWRRSPGELARRLFGDGRSSLMSDGAVGRRLASSQQWGQGLPCDGDEHPVSWLADSSAMGAHR